MKLNHTTNGLDSLHSRHEYTFEFNDRSLCHDLRPLLGQVIAIHIKNVAPFPVPGVQGQFLSNLEVPSQLTIGLPFVARGGWEKYQAIASLSGLHYHCIVSFHHHCGGVFNVVDDDSQIISLSDSQPINS